MKIRINNLFGRYKPVVNLDKKCIIYIGENGVGKSTILKILNCLFEYNYIGLLKYYFESIDIIDGNKITRIRYLDLVPKKEYIVKKFCEKNNSDYKNYCKMKRLYEKEYKKEKYSPEEFSINLCKKLKVDFSIVYKFEDFYNSIDYRLMRKILKWNRSLLNNEDIMIRYAEGSDYYLSWFKDIYNEAKMDAKSGSYTYYRESKIKLSHSLIKTTLDELGFNDKIFIDMSLQFNVENDIDKKYIIKRNIKYAYTNKYKNYLKRPENNKWLYQPTEKYRFDDIKVLEKLKNNHKMIRKEMKFDNNIDIGDWLFNSVYTEEMINDFINDFYDYLYNNYYLCVDHNTEWITIFNEQELEKYSDFINMIKFYICPMIDIEFPNLENIGYHAYSKSGLEFWKGFYKKYKNKYFDINNKKLKRLNSLYKKYFKNKNVVATPFGIIISTSGLKNDINFEELSTGEKKILILFLVSVFLDDMLILLDEPETSLSIIWQQDLLPDIIENTKFKRLIVATQSPYICESDNLDSYIIPLISGDDYE